jgi:hypothetical protein
VLVLQVGVDDDACGELVVAPWIALTIGLTLQLLSREVKSLCHIDISFARKDELATSSHHVQVVVARHRCCVYAAAR